ncbi:Uncharacterised protein [Mycobacteroides abscessus subsp. abscessus]|nr:Uncharacterised protein [Mycobacteroides abscessus subsp. abscessus]SHP18814.1 Uncharacterised protein [Mycobacteroides abscessus subsp. abscessus]SHP89901.1 Uncharacterised protein [Mycobacteroides abscessus subsp. abscessus]SHQ17957.1 Uncharacterised protein [Mycobacteroides abscessus subsp. abscessus]SHQ25813.1 Uncharacterised protein [Mycobacteroides abscessus subsp. abscessus]
MLVWIRLALAPWWIQWLVYSAPIFTTAGVPVAIINLKEQGQWLGWWIGIAIVALIGGLVWALAAWTKAPQLRQLLDGLTPAQYRLAAKAVLSGPIPTDPAIRRAAARLAASAVQRRLGATTPGVRKFLIGTMFVTILFRLGDFAFGRPVTFVNFYTAVLFAGLAVFYWLYPPLLAARAELLARPVHAPLPESGEYRAAVENRP